MALTAQDLAFIVEFIAACRRVEEDGGLETLLGQLRARFGAAAAWTGTCERDATRTVLHSGYDTPEAPLSGCAPARNGVPEPVDAGVRSCQSDATGRSACLFMDLPADAPGREILTHVVPHLLDAVARITARPARANSPVLTAREEQVLRWLAEGKSNWAIGQILGISERTVKYHLANIFTKLGVTTRAQAAAVAISAALVE